MTVSPRTAEATHIIAKQLAALNGIAKSAKSSRDPRLGFERFHRWKARTIRLLSESVHPNEGKKLQDKQTFSMKTYGDPLENLVESVDICSRFLVSLSEELRNHPEDVLNVPALSNDKVKTAKARQPVSKRKPKDANEALLHVYDAIKLHPKITNASRALFKDGYYAQAIFEAYKAVENFVQDRSGLTLFGTNLMEKAFSEENPVIQVPEGGRYVREVQKGFKHLFIGASQGIRNPKAHKTIIQKDAYITLQYLGFFSFLLKRIDYWSTGVA
jgi:uncharacterized protein (TIGR02391 family)